MVGCRAPERAEPPWQALDGLEGEFEYSMVGHSGSGPEAEQLIRWGEPPQGAKARLALLQRMAAHTQVCHPGDQTFEASDLAIKEVAERAAKVITKVTCSLLLQPAVLPKTNFGIETEFAKKKQRR